MCDLLPFFLFRKHSAKGEKAADGAALIRLLYDLGPGFIEAGRIAASRSDIVPDKYQNDLLNLAYPFQALRKIPVEAIVRKELGRKISRDIEHIGKDPLSVNLLGSTHKGILRGGIRVLITVNDSRLTEKFARNLEQLEWIINAIPARASKAHAVIWKTVFLELEARALALCDLTAAAAKEEILFEQFKNSAKIEIPKVHWEYTTRNILTQSHQNLPYLKEVANGSAKGAFSKKYMTRYLIESFALQYFSGGHFLLRPSLSNWQAGEKNKIIFNNFLSVGFLEQEHRKSLALLLSSLLRGRAQEAAKALLMMHYSVHDLDNHKNSGVCLGRIDGDSVSEKLWFALERAWQGNLIVPLGISMAAESILYLEHAFKRFDPEVDLKDGLLRAIGAF